MSNDTYNKWNQLHTNPQSRKVLPDILFDSWDKSYSLGIDPKNSVPNILSDEEFHRKKINSKSLFYYANDVLTTNFKRFNTSNFGVAIFDKTACIIKIHGSEEFLKWAKENKFEEKSVWDENVIGTNAISLGLKLQKPISVIGEQHFSQFAINFAVYFSPIIVEKDTRDIEEHGGIAIVCPIEKENSSFSFTSDTIARAIALHFFWFESVSLFINSVDGYIIIDQSNNRNKIILISDQVFNFLDIPYQDMYYRNLEEIIDPYPYNKEFWNIINSKTTLEDSNIKLSILGNQIKINLSVRAFYGRNFHVQGVSLIFNSHERIHKLISKHTGNNATFTFSQIIGKNEKYLNILKQAEASALSNVNVLLLGESGVGKDIIAQSIHNDSDRKDNPFIALNCASFPKDLISSELFGYDDGAFTGAKKGGNIGKFELANNGTIFLDEIGDMPLDLQAILLRVLEQKSYMKIGSNIPTNINVRIIAATNKNLKEKIMTGEFREDLYYRLGIIRILIPPLRNRKDDILLLADQFIEKICTRVNKPFVTLSPEVKDFFMNYHWPGNVRELQNLLEGVIQVYNSPVIYYEHISNYIMEDSLFEKSPVVSNKKEEEINTKMPSDAFISDYRPVHTKDYLIHALEFNKYNRTKTAEYLGISRNSLYVKLKKYNIK